MARRAKDATNTQDAPRHRRRWQRLLSLPFIPAPIPTKNGQRCCLKKGRKFRPSANEGGTGRAEAAGAGVAGEEMVVTKLKGSAMVQLRAR